MQIINISVMNRPSKSVTSRPYAAELFDAIDFSTTVYAFKSNIPFKENTSFGAGLGTGLVRNLLVKLSDKASMSASAGIADVRISHQVVYHKYRDMQPMSASVGVAGVHVSRKVSHIKYDIGSLDVGTKVGIAGVRRTN